MATDVTKLVLAVDSTQVKTASQDLKGLEGSGLTATKAIKSLATGFVALKLVSAIKDSALMAARFETLGVVMQVVGNNAGYTGAQMEEFAQGLQAAGIAMVESRATIIKMAQAQIDLSKSADLARIAQDAAVIGGVNSSEAFARLTHGIQTAQVETLRTIGINVSFEDSYKKLAGQLGKNAKDLTTVEKTQARVNSVMGAGELIAGSYSASMDTAGKQLLSAKRYMDNLKVVLGETFNDTLVLGVSLFTDGLKDANSAAGDLAANGDLKAWGEDATDALANVATVGQVVWRSLETITSTILALGFEVASFYEAVGKAATFDFDGAKGELHEMAGTLEEWKEQFDKDWRKDFASEALDKIRQARIETRAADKEARDALEAKRIEAAKARAEADKIAEATKTATAEATKLRDSWEAVALQLQQAEELRGLSGLGKDFAEITHQAEALRAQFGPGYSAQIDDWAAAMLGMAQAEHDAAAATERRAQAQATATAIADNNAAAADRVASAMEELTLATMTGEEREIAMITRQYERLQGMARELAMLGEISEVAADQMQQALGVQMAEALDDLKEKGADTGKSLTDSFAGWANSHVKTLNDMLWSSETTFEGIVESFAKMVTEMLIQSAMLDLVGNGQGGSGGTSGIVGSIVNGIDWGSLLSFDGGGDTPAGGRAGGVDGKGGFPAILHPNETVIDNTKNNQPAPQVNTKIVNVMDPSIVGDYLGTSDGEQIIMNVVQKNGG